jgi:hypothetical protein
VTLHAGWRVLLCHGGGLLARRAAGRVGILGQHSTAVGGGDRDVSQHAGGPLVCQGGGLLAGWAVSPHQCRRNPFVVLLDFTVTFLAGKAVFQLPSAGSVDITQPATPPMASVRVSGGNSSTRGYSLSRSCIWACSSA